MNQFPGTNYHDLNLDWLLTEMKTCLSEWASVQSDWESTEQAWNSLRQYVENYFNELDVGPIVNAKVTEIMTQMYNDGQLLALISPTVTTQTISQVDTWLERNISQETGYALDASLTSDQSAAQAKAAGDRITNLETKLASYPSTVDAVTGVRTGLFEPGYYYTQAAGSLVTKATNESALTQAVTTLLPVNPGDLVTMYTAGGEGLGRAYVFVDSDMYAISRSEVNVNGLLTVTAPVGAAAIAVNVRLTVMSSGYYAYVNESIPSQLEKTMTYKGVISNMGVTSLATITETGFYSAQNGYSPNISDMPSDFTNTRSFFLKVWANAYYTITTNKFVRQEIADDVRNEWMRIIRLDGTVVVDWVRITPLVVRVPSVYVSIIGDSNAAYANYIPTGNLKYYPHSGLDVDSPSEMWWSVASSVAGFHLLINDSWSGSCVTNIRNDRKAQSTIDRTQNLHSYIQGTSEDYDLVVTEENISSLRKSPWIDTPDYEVGDYLKEVDPDIVILTGGGNDFIYNAPIGTYDGTQILTDDTTYFTNAYAIMINRVRDRYPNALVVCAVPYFLVKPDMTNNQNQESTNTSGVGYSAYRQAVRDIADLKGCPVISLYDAGFNRYNCYPTYLGDNSETPTHMTAKGQKILGEYVGHQMLNIMVSHNEFLD